MTLTSINRQFILHWGEMGARWGINRTVAQVHALLHISVTPLTAEEIANTLSVARSNVSTSIRELQAWGLVRAVHVLGDRRQLFTSLQDVWEMFRLIAEERKRREIDPTLALLRQCLDESDKGDSADAHSRERLQELYDFFAALDALYADLNKLPTSALRRVLKTRGTVRRLLSRERSKPRTATAKGTE